VSGFGVPSASYLGVCGLSLKVANVRLIGSPAASESRRAVCSPITTSPSPIRHRPLTIARCGQTSWR
jgi:hypothetical protein